MLPHRELRPPMTVDQAMSLLESDYSLAHKVVTGTEVFLTVEVSWSTELSLILFFEGRTFKDDMNLQTQTDPFAWTLNIKPYPNILMHALCIIQKNVRLFLRLYRRFISLRVIVLPTIVQVDLQIHLPHELILLLTMLHQSLPRVHLHPLPLQSQLAMAVIVAVVLVLVLLVVVQQARQLQPFQQVNFYWFDLNNLFDLIKLWPDYREIICMPTPFLSNEIAKHYWAKLFVSLFDLRSNVTYYIFILNIMSLTNRLICLIRPSCNVNQLNQKPKNPTHIVPHVNSLDLWVVNRIHTASLNGLPGQFVGAGQAATASAIDPASSSSSQSPQLNNRKNPPSSLNENQASFDIVASSSSTPQPPSLTAATTTTTTTTATTLSQSRPKIGQQNNFLQNNRQQVNSGIELPQSPSHSSGPSATTNSISVHPGLLSQSQAPPPSAPHQTINQQQLNSLLSNVGSSSIGPISATATSPSSVPILPTLAVSNSATGNTSPSHHHHLHHNQQQQQHQSHKQQQQHTNGANILASSFQPPIRSQNSLASTKYSLDGIIATAIFGGFIFLGAIITIIVIILRR